jgi:hypothetical protein
MTNVFAAVTNVTGVTNTFVNCIGKGGGICVCPPPNKCLEHTGDTVTPVTTFRINDLQWPVMSFKPVTLAGRRGQ